jgi:hypothetical protein
MTIVIPLKGGSLSKTYRLPQYDIVRKEVSRTENREYGFMRWYSQLMKLQHFNQIYPGLFAEVVAVGSTGVDAWFDLKYLHGFRDIKSILSGEPLKEETIFKISKAVWKGLNTVHSVGRTPIPGAPSLYFREEIHQKLMDALKIPAFDDFFRKGSYWLNSRPVTGLTGTLAIHGPIHEFFSHLENDDECNIHGNPTLENIMYSFDEDRVVFIDTYEESMWNTKYLDYAQVLQCSRSHYGFINDRDVRVVETDFMNPNTIPKNFEIFNEHFVAELPKDKMKLIDILEASQFIRMLPFKLLAGDTDKAKYFYVHASKLFHEALDE